MFFADDGPAAVNYCLEVAHRHKVDRVVKGKSMVSEEIGLNDALIDSGIDVSETDLGEYIIQLAGETPSHIIAPAIHKTRDDVGSLFADKLDIPYETDPPRLTWIARKALREKFLTADMGTSGCNIACAETGHITTVSNEGNIRMSCQSFLDDRRVDVVTTTDDQILGASGDPEIAFLVNTTQIAGAQVAFIPSV